jgi:hypothetical protein
VKIMRHKTGVMTKFGPKILVQRHGHTLRECLLVPLKSLCGQRTEDGTYSQQHSKRDSARVSIAAFLSPPNGVWDNRYHS